MPHAKCSKCGGEHHLSVAVPLVDWHREHSPGTKPGETAAVLCPSCWLIERNPSPEYLRLAKDTAKAVEARRGREDVNEWAARLAKESAEFND